MIPITKPYFFVFAALTAAGGLMGYLKAQSTASLIAGGIAGLLLAAAAFMLEQKPVPALSLAIVISLLLLGRFGSVYLKKGAAMPAIPMVVMSAIGLALAVASLLKR